MEIAAPLKPAAAEDAAQHAGAFRRGLPISGTSVLLVLITLAAALFRFHALANRGLWLDETFSANISGSTLPKLFQIIRGRDIDMALYFVLLHFWMALGDSEFALRSLSVVFSVATVPFIYALGARLFGRNAGLVAAGLLAFNAFHIRYAQEARSYALAVLLATISTWLLVRNLQEPEKASWTLYGIFLALTVYSHMLSVLIVVAHGAAILCFPPRTIPWKGLTRSAIWFIGLTLPIGLIYARIVMRAGALDWVSMADPSTVLHFLVLTSGNRGILLLALDAIAIGAFAYQMGRTWLRDGRSIEKPYVLLLLWFFLPVVIAVAVSGIQPFFVPRYFLPCLPAFLLAVSAGLTYIRPRSVAWALGGAVFVLSLMGIASCYHLQDVVDDWRVISSGILSQTEPGDGISFYPEYARISFEHYRVQKTPLPEWPEDRALAPSRVATPTNHSSGLEVRPDTNDMPTKRLWIVFHHPGPMTVQQRGNLRTNLVSWRSEGWPLQQVQEFPDVTVLLFAVSSADAVAPGALPNLFEPANGAATVSSASPAVVVGVVNHNSPGVQLAK